MRLDAQVLRRQWPHAPQALVDAVAAKSATVFARHGITTPMRAAHFMAQISHESGGGTITEESLDYTHAERIAQVWPTRFTVASAQACVRNPKALADKVYDGRMGNGPAPSDDGFNYRGRGLLQITGRDSYREIGGLCGLPLESNPELAYSPLYTLEVAATEFEHLGCLPWCDKDDLHHVTRLVNGGYTGYQDRADWLDRWKAVRFDTDEMPPVPVSPRPSAEKPQASQAPAMPDGGPVSPADQPTPPPAPPAPPPPLPPPPPPALPRGSDEQLPPQTDKTMRGSRTGWAAVLATITAVGSQIGQAVDALKPLLQDQRTIITVVAIAVGTGAFIWWDRRNKLKEGV